MRLRHLVFALIVALPLCTLVASCGTADAPPSLESDASPPRFTASDYRAAIVAPASGYVVVDGAPSAVMREGQRLEMGGWALESASLPCEAIGLVIDRSEVVAGTYGIQRPDVAAAFMQYTLWWSGYHISEPASVLGPGSHIVYVVCRTKSGAMYRNSQTFTVTVL